MAVAFPPPSHRFKALLRSVGTEDNQSLNKDNSKQRALTSQCPLHRRYMLDKRKKKPFQKRARRVTAALKAMPAQCLILLYHSLVFHLHRLLVAVGGFEPPTLSQYVGRIPQVTAL